MPQAIKVNYYEFTTPPAGEVVSLDLVKANARVTSTSEDVLIQFYIDMAVDRISRLTGRLLQPAVLQGFYPFPTAGKFNRFLYVPVERAPITAINEVAIWDGTTQDYVALTTDQWDQEATATYSRILFDSTVIFDNTIDNDDLEPYLIRVDFDAGYPTSDDIPDSLRGAVMQYATWLYKNRGDCSNCAPGTTRNVGGFPFPNTLADLVCSFIIRRIFG